MHENDEYDRPSVSLVGALPGTKPSFVLRGEIMGQANSTTVVKEW